MKKSLSYPVGKTIKKMLAHVKKERKSLFAQFALYTFIAFITPFFAIVLPKVLIAELKLGTAASITNVIYIIFGYFILAGIFSYAMQISKNFNYPKITYLRINQMRDMMNKILCIDYRYMEDAKFSEDNQRAFEATGGNNNGVELVYHKLFEVPANILTILVLVFFIGRLNLLILLGMFINLFVMLYVKRKVQQYSYSKKAEVAHWFRRMNYYNTTTHNFEFGKDIRVYNLKDRIINNYTEEINGYVNINKIIKNREFVLGFLALLALIISDVLTYGILINKTVNGMMIEDFSMYLLAITTLSTMLRTLADDISIVYNEGQYVNDFYNFKDGNLYNTGGDQKAQNETLEIEFKDVSFKYPNTDIYLFEHLNFTIHKGEKLAIVGINGAGKTTLVKLMIGLFDVTDGDIFINGIGIKEYNKKELYKMFSVVFQDVVILPFTIKENVACNSDNIDEQRVLTCLDKVGLKDKILAYKHGLDTIMSKIIDEDGVDMSGGERQKLSIARALYKDANMVIMDEPTAALDALAEAEIYQNFSELVQGKTAIYISHRLASTKFCDKIALFDNKQLLEYGNHEELMDLHGKYYEMFTVQGKYYKKEGALNE